MLLDGIRRLVAVAVVAGVGFGLIGIGMAGDAGIRLLAIAVVERKDMGEGGELPAHGFVATRAVDSKLSFVAVRRDVARLALARRSLVDMALMAIAATDRPMFPRQGKAGPVVVEAGKAGQFRVAPPVLGVAIAALPRIGH